MRRLPRAPRKILGVPITKSTIEDVKIALTDIMKNQYVSQEIRDSRKNICATCEHYNPRWKQCKLCGCQMQIKTNLASSKCPVHKW